VKPSVFVDGQEGTTGLRIHEYLAARSDIQILKIDPEKRKDASARQELLNAADVVFLCLPDAAAREAVALIDNPRTRVIDASTAFRTDPAWVYGLPEISAAQREKVRHAKRVAVPGCHASAFILPLAPLVAEGIVPADAPLSCFSLTGYSGGGKKMIAAYEAPARDPKLAAPRPYALKLTHKHLPEMQKIVGLRYPPIFTPVVCPVHSGLAVETFLPTRELVGKAAGGEWPQALAEKLAAHYAGERFVRVMPYESDAFLDDGFFDITACNGTNRAEIFVFGHADQVVLITRLDNLGKGASGAAVQCLNLLLGVDEATGLRC
jgi:N-acetyl-gamma-glutamyl-phosphate reductase